MAPRLPSMACTASTSTLLTRAEIMIATSISESNQSYTRSSEQPGLRVTTRLEETRWVRSAHLDRGRQRIIPMVKNTQRQRRTVRNLAHTFAIQLREWITR